MIYLYHTIRLCFGKGLPQFCRNLPWEVSLWSTFHTLPIVGSKKRSRNSLRPRKHYTAKVSHKRMRMAATWARVAEAPGEMTPPLPAMSPAPLAHWRAGRA